MLTPQYPKVDQLLTGLPLQSFAKRELPELHRVIPPGAMVTKDFRPDRLNVHVKDDGTVSHVTHG